MEFSLLNHESETQNIILELQKFGFKIFKLTKKECLSFVEIYDNNFSSCITRIVYNEEFQLCLHIYKMFNCEKNINIPLKNIQTIDCLNME